MKIDNEALVQTISIDEDMLFLATHEPHFCLTHFSNTDFRATQILQLADKVISISVLKVDIKSQFYCVLTLESGHLLFFNFILEHHNVAINFMQQHTMRKIM
jgi:hypothetical protein